MKFAIMSAANAIFNIVYLLIIIKVFASWIPFLYSNATMGKIMYMIETLTEPIMRPVRNLLMKTPMANMPVDFSPIIVLLLLQFVQMAVGVLLGAVIPNGW